MEVGGWILSRARAVLAWGRGGNEVARWRVARREVVRWQVCALKVEQGQGCAGMGPGWE